MMIKLLPVRSFLFSLSFFWFSFLSFRFRYEAFRLRFRFLVCYELLRNKPKRPHSFSTPRPFKNITNKNIRF